VRRILTFRRLGIPREERRDLEQVIVVQLWEAVRRQGFEGAGFWGLVETVAARRSIDWLRARRDEVDADALPEQPDPHHGPLRRVLDRERAERLEAILARLSPDCRELLRLHFMEGKPYAEIAAETGKSQGALRVQLHRCVKRAGGLLRSSGEDSG
jgi:RNA polymerase sigma-70 factor (ECF subfamily)